MAEAEVSQEETPKKTSKLPFLIGGALALALGGAGFFAAWSGMIFAPSENHAAAAEVGVLADIGFVPVDPVVISLGAASSKQHLRMTAQLEVAKTHSRDVTLLMPRILDVLNGYLRAVEVAELEDPTALVRLRSQMLRRIQIVTGEGRVRDLLITEFVLN
ncbi:flagellar basal body-associated FliL family protein [Paracoccaceae bacterium Fryx2]|nr:flagellar basal body-associated FliL family protein [Paracoccaceae bacterium Fryx2]